MSLNASVRGEGGRDIDAAALIRVEEVRIGREPVENGIQLPLSTCMYLGDRWECLFKHGASSVRAYSKHRIDPGQYWLEMPAEKLWVF
jgi:iron(III) transport system ATP-binding protein